MYDIIGDVHGHADELSRLLELLGYRNKDGVYQHPTRTAVFVGDYIDRGPQIRETLGLVYAMCESGGALAVMGNHEFNALAFHTSDPANPDRYLRGHSENNTRQHAETLKQVPEGELHDYLEWFRGLPMWLQLDGLRIVHACWDAQQMAVIDEARHAHGGVSTAFLHRATSRETPLFHAIEDVLKGKEVILPDGMCYRDKDGHVRRAMRIKWFRSPQNDTYASYALTVDEGLPCVAISPALVDSVKTYPRDADPVFFGHYWLRAERPARLESNVACLDFSVARGGRLCAYRWDGERDLSNDNFYSVPARQA